MKFKIKGRWGNQSNSVRALWKETQDHAWLLGQISRRNAGGLTSFVHFCLLMTATLHQRVPASSLITDCWVGRSHSPVNRGATHAGVRRVDASTVNVVFGVLASCWAFHHELRINDLSSFDITVDLRYSWEHKMRSKLPPCCVSFYMRWHVRSLSIRLLNLWQSESELTLYPFFPYNEGKDIARVFLRSKEWWHLLYLIMLKEKNNKGQLLFWFGQPVNRT